jgi:two-component system sensor kinase FixL
MAEHYWYKDLFLRTSELIQIISPEGDIVAVNPAWLSAMEFSLEEVIGRSIYEFPEPKKLAAYKEFREQIIRTKSSGEISTIFLSKSGKRVHLSGIMEHINNEDRHYSRAIFRNTTEEEYGSLQNQLDKKRLETVFYHAPDAIITIDEEHRIVEWNPRAEEMFGHSEQEVKGKKIQHVIIPPEMREAHEKGMAHFLRTGEGPVLNKTIEVPALRSDGQRLFINLTISHVRVNDRWLFIAFLSDITAKKNLEKQKREGEIKLKVQTELNEEKDHFLSVASHELKTPLTNLQLLIQLSNKTIESGNVDKVRQYLDKTVKHIQSINKIVDDLLNISRLKDGKLHLDMRPFDINATINEVMSTYQLLHNTHIFTYTPAQKCLAEGDEEKIKQVMQNILNNAARYSPKGSAIKITAECDDNNFTVTVSDRGIGIPEEEREKIFERFHRAKNALHESQGLGIGMNISKEIITRHRGKIWMEPNADQGSSFTFTIPIFKG